MEQFLPEMVFHLFWEDYCPIVSLGRSGRLTVWEERTASSWEVTLAALRKMPRMLTTILGQIHAIRFHREGLGLDRAGSRIEENYIGTFPQTCRHSH
jgi:hypothetical protein